ncbi:hypothetical protein VNI00_016429 [Paramarasmius palmivorus]|uniref:Uncharacterized protein n=1 Tax=Paramarasmius palmivorus TaxID=297713 RepID=A0AAW0BEG6_9AGAR
MPLPKLFWREKSTLTLPTHRLNEMDLRFVAFSPAARFLAVGYVHRIEIWSMKDIESDKLEPMLPFQCTTELCYLSWIGPTRFFAGCQEGRMYVVDVANSIDMRLVMTKSHGSILSATCLTQVDGSDVFAICSGDCVEIWSIPLSMPAQSSRSIINPLEDLQDTWKYFGQLPVPPQISGHKQPTNRFTSAYALDSTKLLVSYWKRSIVIWEVDLHVDPIEADVVDCIEMNGRVSDVSTNNFLVVNKFRNEYQLHHVNTSDKARTFVPRSQFFGRAYAVDDIRFLSADTIIGTGEGKLILWTVKGRLKQYLSCRRGGSVVTFSSMYVPHNDTGHLVVAVNDRDKSEMRLVFWETSAIDHGFLWQSMIPTVIASLTVVGIALVVSILN